MGNFKHKKECSFYVVLILHLVFICNVCLSASSVTEYVSAVGDPGMKRDSLRLAIESWNQCNEVGEEVPHMGSPRAADCFDIYKASPQSYSNFSFSLSAFFFIKENVCSSCFFFHLRLSSITTRLNM